MITSFLMKDGSICKKELKFKVGDKVIVKNPGNNYSIFFPLFEYFGFKNLVNEKKFNIKRDSKRLFIIKNFVYYGGYHNEFPTIIAHIQSIDGNVEYAIGIDGLGKNVLCQEYFIKNNKPKDNKNNVFNEFIYY